MPVENSNLLLPFFFFFFFLNGNNKMCYRDHNYVEN